MEKYNFLKIDNANSIFADVKSIMQLSHRREIIWVRKTGYWYVGGSFCYNYADDYSVAIMQLETSAAHMQLTVSAANMWVAGNWMVKSKLPPRSGCSREAVEPHP